MANLPDYIVQSLAAPDDDWPEIRVDDLINDDGYLRIYVGRLNAAAIAELGSTDADNCGITIAPSDILTLLITIAWLARSYEKIIP